jgi:hypothetical protein
LRPFDLRQRRSGAGYPEITSKLCDLYRGEFVSREQMQPKMYVTALYDYDPQSGDELAFREGDRLAVFDDESDPDWWVVRHSAVGQDTGAYGLVPSNYVAPEDLAIAPAVSVIPVRSRVGWRVDIQSPELIAISTNASPVVDVSVPPVARESSANSLDSNDSANGEATIADASSVAKYYSVAVRDFTSRINKFLGYAKEWIEKAAEPPGHARNCQPAAHVCQRKGQERHPAMAAHRYHEMVAG